MPVLTEETGAMGSAILGFAALSHEDPIAIAARFIRYGEIIHPHTKRQAIYNKRYELYKKLRNIYKDL